MSTKEDAPAWENGLAIGIVVLAILFAFAVGLTRLHKHDVGGGLTLPDTLSGGYQAIELTSYDQFPAAQRQQLSQNQFNTEIAALQKAETTESSALTNAFGIAVQTRTYLSQDLQTSLSVLVSRGPGGVFGNGRNLANQQTGAAGTGSMQRVGDSVCYSDPGDAQSQTSPQAVCQRSSDNLTVQVTASDGKVATASAAVDDIYNSIGNRHF